jgi:nucleoside-diphosphate-sugar epimerase
VAIPGRGKMKYVLCTGGTGWVGTWIENTKPDNVFLVRQNYEHYQSRWELGNWDYIIHLAPISPSRVIDYCHCKHIKFLHASSGVVYEGRGKYADDKRAWEEECIRGDVNVVIARLFATSGLPFQKNKALSEFVESALRRESLKVWGNGLTVRSYLYGEEVGKWFWEMLLRGNGIYDVGSMLPYSMGEIAEMVVSIIPSKIEFIDHEEMPTPTYYVPQNYWRALELGCKETVSLKEAIKRMVRG